MGTLIFGFYCQQQNSESTVAHCNRISHEGGLLVDIKSQADQVIHATEKSLEDLGEKVTNEERSNIESSLNDVKDAIKTDDKDKIESKLKTLSEASVGIAQKAFEEAQAKAQNETQSDESDDEENVVDAEYEEVDSEEEKNTH